MTDRNCSGSRPLGLVIIVPVVGIVQRQIIVTNLTPIGFTLLESLHSLSCLETYGGIMPRSMTAYARTVSEFEWGSICCELRSVNHRFLEVSFRMPETLRELEVQLRDKTRKKLNRER